MFESVTLRGRSAALLWGYRTAATLKEWTIAKGKKTGTWTLTATIEKADAFQARQRPIRFAAPRERGHWYWEVQEIHLGERQLTATLGQPLQ